MLVSQSNPFFSISFARDVSLVKVRFDTKKGQNFADVEK
jgi:hypothetical protein